MNNNEKVMPVWENGSTPVNAENLNSMVDGINQKGNDIEALSEAMALLNNNKFDKVTLEGSELKFYAKEVEKFSITLPTGSGGSGVPGRDGREIELQKSDTHIQWRYVGDSNWTSLVSLEELRGDNGKDGVNGITPNIQIGTVTTVEHNQNATVTRRGTNEEPVFDFAIPKGAPAVNDGSGGSVDLSAYQTKRDETLTTEDKTVVGAINEIASDTSQKADKDFKNVNKNAIKNDKLEEKTQFVLENLTSNLNIVLFLFEYGIISASGIYGDNESSAIALNNVRTTTKHKVEETSIALISDNVMLKVVYYDNNDEYLRDTGWMSKIATDWTSGGVNNYKIESGSNVAICLADTTLNNTGSFTATVDEMVSRISINSESSSFIKGEFIKKEGITENLLEKKLSTKLFTNVVDGVITLPSEFGELPFDILKEKNRYNISLSDKQLNINPVIIYISDNGSSVGLGINKNEPITLKQAKQNFVDNLYSSKNIKLIFLDNVYFMSSKSDFDLIGTGQDNTITNLTIESENFTWIGYGKKNVTWTQHESNTNLYVTTENKKVSDLADIENLRNNGMPSLYIKKDSLSSVTKEGDFCQVGDKVYVYPYTTNDINEINLIYGFDYSTDKNIAGIITIRKNTKGNVVFKNIGTFLDCLNLRDLKSLNVWYYFLNCRFHRSSMDSLALDGQYKAVLIDCIADYSSKDNYNYHSTSKDSVAIELNCKSYGAGQYKLDTVGVNTTTDSCNGSTAHDGMCIARFGCSYWDCEGTVVADVNNCVTYCVDCSVKNILPTISNSDYKSSFMLHDNRHASKILRPDDNHINYLINCICGGKNITWGVRSEGMKINIANFRGNDEHFMEKTNDITLVNISI